MASDCPVDETLSSPSLGSYGAGIGHNKTMGRLVRDVRNQERTDMRNRFLSISMDAKFVSELVAAYRRNDCSYPVFANLRNGLWYGKEWNGACYFKSTDGHSRRWSFSYTRLNLHLAAAAAASGGCILVDSTRTGKRFPDSFTATVPIWCCVLNRLAAPEEDACHVSGNTRNAGACDGGAPVRRGEGGTATAWDTALHTPRWLSASEASQIEERIPKWLEGLGGARKELSKRLRSFLKKPLRALWLCPESRLVEGMLPACPPSDLAFTPVICVSASKVISPERHREHHSWVYLQGAGDDEEHWSCGLTPETFWENSERLVELAEGGNRNDFESAVAALLAGKKKSSSSSSSSSHAAGSLGSQSGPNDESTGVTMSTSAAQVLGQSGSAGSGSLSGVGGGGRDNARLPGGQELHAALGNTGLVVSSLAFAARNWARLGSNYSLLNLSDEPVPESFVKSLTGPDRRYLHIPLRAGKKANPPRYWKTKVFPAALTFIASTIGKAPPRQQDEPHTESAQGRVHSVPRGSAAAPVMSSTSACETFVSGSALASDGARNTAGPVMLSSPARVVSVSECFTPEDGARNASGSIVSSSPARKKNVSGCGSAEEGAPNYREAAGGTGRRFSDDEEQGEVEGALGEAIVHRPEPPRSIEQPPSAAALARRFERSLEQPLSTAALAERVESSYAWPASLPPPQRRHAQRCASSRGAAGKCLVACPTGAEASVVVCLAALAAFFPPPPGSTASNHGAPRAVLEDRGTPENRAIAENRVTAENRAVPEIREKPETREVPKNGRIPQHRGAPENRATAETGSTPETRGTPENRATAEVSGKRETETDEQDPGLQLEQDGFAVLRRGAGVVTKPQLRWRFLLLQQECPWARPPRRLMQELNEYFMTPGQHSWWSLSDQLLLRGSDCGEGTH